MPTAVLTTHGFPEQIRPEDHPTRPNVTLGTGMRTGNVNSLPHLAERGLQVRRAPAKRVAARLRQDRMSGPPEKTTLASSGDGVPEVRTQGSRGESVITQFCHGSPLNTSPCKGFSLCWVDELPPPLSLCPGGRHFHHVRRARCHPSSKSNPSATTSFKEPALVSVARSPSP